jgi:hypothetical protein
MLRQPTYSEIFVNRLTEKYGLEAEKQDTDTLKIPRATVFFELSFIYCWELFFEN